MKIIRLSVLLLTAVSFSTILITSIINTPTELAKDMPIAHFQFEGSEHYQ